MLETVRMTDAAASFRPNLHDQAPMTATDKTSPRRELAAHEKHRVVKAQVQFEQASWVVRLASRLGKVRKRGFDVRAVAKGSIQRPIGNQGHDLRLPLPGPDTYSNSPRKR